METSLNQGKILIREKKLLFAGEQPDAVRRYARNLNFRSAHAKRLETHFLTGI